MLSCDTNILVYAYNTSAGEHRSALAFLESHLEDRNFALSELILVEFYVLIRNPTVFPQALSASRAASKVQELRANPYWTILKGDADISEQIWDVASIDNFPRRAIFDARIAYSLAADGVTHFATRNIGDFQRFKTFSLFDPTASED